MVVFHGLTLVLAVLFKFAVTESSKEEDPRIVHGQVGIYLSFLSTSFSGSSKGLFALSGLGPAKLQQ